MRQSSSARMLSYLLALFLLCSPALHAEDSTDKKLRFGFAINPLSYSGLKPGGEEGLLSLEFTARSKDSRLELATPIWYEHQSYDGGVYSSDFPPGLHYRYFAMDLALRYYVRPETSRFYLGPVLRYQRESGGLADWEEYPEFKDAQVAPKITQSNVGMGGTIGFGRKIRGRSLVHYWGTSFTFGWLVGAQNKRLEYPFGLFNFLSLTSPGGEKNQFWDFTFFRWGIQF